MTRQRMGYQSGRSVTDMIIVASAMKYVHVSMNDQRHAMTDSNSRTQSRMVHVTHHAKQCTLNCKPRRANGHHAKTINTYVHLYTHTAAGVMQRALLGNKLTLPNLRPSSRRLGIHRILSSNSGFFNALLTPAEILALVSAAYRHVCLH